jgi:hypothetical protein
VAIALVTGGRWRVCVAMLRRPDSCQIPDTDVEPISSFVTRCPTRPCLKKAQNGVSHQRRLDGCVAENAFARSRRCLAGSIDEAERL